jgi:hypothetical protein
MVEEADFDLRIIAYLPVHLLRDDQGEIKACFIRFFQADGPDVRLVAVNGGHEAQRIFIGKLDIFLKVHSILLMKRNNTIAIAYPDPETVEKMQHCLKIEKSQSFSALDMLYAAPPAHFPSRCLMPEAQDECGGGRRRDRQLVHG